jgi:hypothetical protein
VSAPVKVPRLGKPCARCHSGPQWAVCAGCQKAICSSCTDRYLAIPVLCVNCYADPATDAAILADYAKGRP